MNKDDLDNLTTIDLIATIDTLKIGNKVGYTTGGSRDYERGYDDALEEIKSRLSTNL